MAEKETPDEIAARVRANLPKFLVRTEDEEKKDNEAQLLQRASFGRAHMTEAEKLVSRGMQMEEIARANIETQEALREEGHNVSTRGGANQYMLTLELFRLAEGLEMQGRFQEAAGVHPHAREQARLLKIEEAIEKDDAEVCDCPPTVANLDGQEVEIQPYFEIKKIFSRKHRDVVSLVGCSKCGEPVNATPTPPEQLANILATHSASHSAVAATRATTKSNVPVAVRAKDIQLMRVEKSNS